MAMNYNGHAVLAMVGDGCVAIAADRRFGIQAQTVSMDFQKIFQMGDRLFIGLTGLATDIQTVAQRLKFRMNMYRLREEREMRPETFMNLVSNFLYEKRFGPYFCEPIIAGLDPVTKAPFVCAMDLIGCPNTPGNFVVGGTASEQLYGMCESLWEPNMNREELFEAASQALMNAQDRDALSGWGGVVYLIEPERVTIRTLKTRMD